MSTTTKASIAFLLAVLGLVAIWLIVLSRLSGTGSASPDPVATAAPVEQTPLVGHWVADDWAGEANDWIDRVNGVRASIGSLESAPTNVAGAITTSASRAGLVFDGVDDYFLVSADDNPIQAARRMTIVALFTATKPASGVDDNRWWNQPGPLHGDSPGPVNDWGLAYDAAGNAQAFFGAPIDVSPAVNIVDGEAHTMIMTWESTSVGGDAIARFFVDGEQVGEVETPDERSGITNENGFVIGTDAESASICCIGSPTNRFFAGAIGELRLYESIEEPRRLHAELFGGAAVTTPTITIAEGTVTVRGLAYSAGPTVEASFRYGTDAELEISTSIATAAATAATGGDGGEGGATLDLSAQLNDLTAGTRYFFRVEMENEAGSFIGATQSFLVGGEIAVADPADEALPNGTQRLEFLGAPGLATAPKVLTIANTGDLDLQDISVSIRGTAAEEFGVDATAISPLGPGASTSLSIVFTPIDEGERTATLRIESTTADVFELLLVGEGATVWNGPATTFTNTCAACATDQITPTVALTRGPNSGIFNAVAETESAGKEGLSPVDTEWAYGTTASLGELDFLPWFAWLGFKRPALAINQDAVLHIISDDIYIDIRFTSWDDGQSTGGFSYTRATPSE